MDLEEQHNMLERALSECMLNHAFVILRSWLKDLAGVKQELAVGSYMDRIRSLERSYDELFRFYLTTEDPERNAILENMTTEVYRLVDEVYADMRVLRGMSPQMYGFNPDNADSVINYFGSCVHLQDDDLDWLVRIAAQQEHAAMAMLASAALGHNLRMCFNEHAALALFRIASDGCSLVREQALAHVILLLAHYDLRIDLFPHLQDAFTELVGDGDDAFLTMAAMIKGSKVKIKEMLLSDDLDTDMLPESMREAFSGVDSHLSIEQLAQWMPDDENTYMLEVISMLPDTWVFGELVNDDERREQIAMLYISIGMADIAFDGVLLGRLDLCTNHYLSAGMLLHQGLYNEALEAYLELEKEEPDNAHTQLRIGWCALLAGEYDTAEQYMLQRLRSEAPEVNDYINYGHLCWLRGDRVTAYENYREARRIAGSAKHFMIAFRPDRRLLMERGIPLEEIYLMEDRLVNIRN